MRSEKRIVKDARVLEEHFILRRILHRNGQLEAMRNNLSPVLEGKRPRDMHLYGPPGAGKTCMARYLLEELDKKSGRVKTSYVNCFENSSRFRVLYEIVKDIGTVLSVHEKGTPTDEVLEKLKRLVDESFCVLILDEVDKLRETGVLYPGKDSGDRARLHLQQGDGSLGRGPKDQELPGVTGENRVPGVRDRGAGGHAGGPG